jgi:hypothetical protein
MRTVIHSAMTPVDGPGPGDGAERIDVLGAGSLLLRPGHPRLDLRPTGTRIVSSGMVEIRCAP